MAGLTAYLLQDDNESWKPPMPVFSLLEQATQPVTVTIQTQQKAPACAPVAMRCIHNDYDVQDVDIDIMHACSEAYGVSASLCTASATGCRC